MDEISFTSGRDRCAAWHFDANGDAFAGERGVPCVVMAPGFAGTRDTSALMDYARGFAAAGLAVVLFDYRGFGGSGGSPRQLVSASRQRRDYRAAIAAARQLPGVDPERIVLWGISYSGGHVVRVAAEEGRVAAVVALTPAIDGVTVLARLACTVGTRHLLRAAAHGMRDAQRAMTRRKPHLVPMVGEPGSRAIFAMDGAEQDYGEVAGRAGATRCARARRSRWRSTGRSGSRRGSVARFWCRPAPQTASPRWPPPVERPSEPVFTGSCANTRSTTWTFIPSPSSAPPCRSARFPGPPSVAHRAPGRPQAPSRIDFTSERREPSKRH